MLALVATGARRENHDVYSVCYYMLYTLLSEYSHFAPLPGVTFIFGLSLSKSTPTERRALTHHSGYAAPPKYSEKNEHKYSGNVPAIIDSLARPITCA